MPYMGIGMAAEKTVIHKKGNGHPGDAEEDPLDLLDIERRPVKIGKAETGAVDVDETDAAKEEDQDKEGPVKVEDETAVKFDHGLLFPPLPALLYQG
jgi:hypothetical protein